RRWHSRQPSSATSSPAKPRSGPKSSAQQTSGPSERLKGVSSPAERRDRYPPRLRIVADDPDALGAEYKNTRIGCLFIRGRVSTLPGEPAQMFLCDLDRNPIDLR